MSVQQNGQFDTSSLLSTCPVMSSTDLNVESGRTSKADLERPFPPISDTNFGLLGNYTGVLRAVAATTPDTSAYMTFERLNNTGPIDDPNSRLYWLSRRYTTLLNKGIIPANPTLTTIKSSLLQPPSVLDPVATYNTAVANFLRDIGIEFCYYQKNYFIAVNQFLTQYSLSSTTGNGAQDLNILQNTALLLNQKVNTMISLINYFASNNISILQSLQLQFNGQNADIATVTQKLQQQGRILKEYNTKNTLYRQMVEYTEEKNRANKNLLAVYFTLNVVAITCLFIAARSL